MLNGLPAQWVVARVWSLTSPAPVTDVVAVQDVSLRPPPVLPVTYPAAWYPDPDGRDSNGGRTACHGRRIPGAPSRRPRSRPGRRRVTSEVEHLIRRADRRGSALEEHSLRVFHKRDPH